MGFTRIPQVFLCFERKTETNQAASQHKRRIAFYSVLVGITLTSLKLTVGLLTGSLGILSEALHSLLDLGAALITFFSVGISTKPPDSRHQFGHGKMENVSALAEALLLLITCAWIVYEAVQRLIGKEVQVEVTFWAFLVMGISLLLDVLISRLLYAGARKYQSQALAADGLHYSSDILSSAVVILGLIGVSLGVPVLDPIAALGVAILVTIASIRLGKQAIDELLDQAPRGLADRIVAKLQAVPMLDKVEQIRVRRSGARIFVDLLVSARRLLTVSNSQFLIQQIEAEVKTVAPSSDVIVQFSPSAIGENFFESIQAISQRFSQIQELHNIHSYLNSSGRFFISQHVKLAPTLSLQEAHDLVDVLERSLKEELPQIDDVETHIETIGVQGNGSRLALAPEQLRILREEVLRDPRVLEVHDIQNHQSTQGSILSCHILIRNELPLEEAHQVATMVEDRIKNLFPFLDEVVVHAEPTSTK